MNVQTKIKHFIKLQTMHYNFDTTVFDINLLHISKVLPFLDYILSRGKALDTA